MNRILGEPRTAREILSLTLIDDCDHENIMVAAGEMVAAGLGHYYYQGLYTDPRDGSTCWTRFRTMHKESRLTTVDYYGRID